jgi:hypothetical protein
VRHEETVVQDRPTAGELLQAAREFCERDLVPNLTGRLRFHARVLQNVLGILEREWAGEEQAVRAEWDRLRELLNEEDEPAASFKNLAERVREANRALSAKIRSGEMDDRWDEVLDAVEATVSEKLKIANPGYSAGAASSSGTT